MASRGKSVADKKRTKIITVKSANKPSREKGIQKIKELSEFLSKTWHMPISSK